MIKVLIVDDEPKVRKTLQTLLRLSDPGIQIVGEGESGIQGLKLIEELNPDLIFLDVVMPEMDGLEVLAHLQRKREYRHVIIVSGYDDFNYAKKAIGFNVIDYILKPFDREDVSDALQKAAQRMSVQETMIAMESTIHRNNKESLLRRQDAIRQKIYEGKPLSAESFAELPAYGKSGMWHVCLVVVQNYYDSVSDRYHGDRELFSYILCKCIGELLESYRLSCVIGASPAYQHLVYWLIVPQKIDHRMFAEIMLSVQDMLKVDGFVLRREEPVVKERVSSAIHKLEEHIVHTNLRRFTTQPVYTWNKDSKSAPELLIAQIGEWTRKMSYVVKHPQKKRIENMIGELFERWERQGLLTCHFLFLAYSSLTQLSPDAEILEESHIDSFNFGVRMHFNADAIRSHFIQLLHKIIAFEQNKELESSADRMDTIKAYIDRHFAEPLSLNGLAHQFYISKEYLANRFKSKYSVTVHQYLHCIRLRTSADLLQDRQYRISDVALMVGYDNFSYFNKLFRKEFGVTPSEYRERHQQINNVLEH